jgi:hypothetical protein
MNLFRSLNVRNVRVQSICARVFIALLIISVNFQVPDLSYTIGIDSPLKWIFNHFFEVGLREGREIIFPHGPLSFFNFPLHQNLLFVLIIQGLLQVSMILGIFRLGGFYRENEWLVPILVSCTLVSLLNFYMIVLANLIVAYLIYFHTGNNLCKYAGILLTAFACYIKVHTALLSLSVTIPFILLEWRDTKKWSAPLKEGAVLLLSLSALWFLMYGSFSGLLRYFYGIYNLGLGNSEAMGLNPDNSWILIAVFLVIVLVLPFVQKTREGTYFGLLFLLSLFMAWKHGMAREDLPHNRIFFIYVFMLMILFLVFNRKNILFNALMIGIGLTAFYWNLSRLPDFTPRRIEFFGINNFIGFISGYGETIEKASSDTRKNLESNRLPEQIRHEIGRSTADTYPWDYSIIPANDLNWEPRPVLQSFLAYTGWLENQNVLHFRSGNSPDYIIWDLDKITVDRNGGQWESVDTKYLLNDEPDLLILLICRYQSVYKDESFLVLKKREIPLEYDSRETGEINHQWDRWIAVPGNEGDILRAKVRIRKNLPGTLKSILYKDEISEISFCLSNSKKVRYRIVPEKCKEGLWLDPFLFDKEFLLPGYRIDSIMFSSTNKHCMNDMIRVNWETIQFKNLQSNPVISFFRMDTISGQGPPPGCGPGNPRISLHWQCAPFHRVNGGSGWWDQKRSCPVPGKRPR